MDHEMSDKEMSACAGYVATLVFNALGEAFGGARQIQRWLNNAASLVSKSQPEDALPERTRLLSQIVLEKGLLKDYSVAFEMPKPVSVDVGLEVEELESREVTDLEQWLLEEKDDLTDEDLGIDIHALVVPGEEDQTVVKSTRATVSNATNVCWTTPLGLPIVQPYKKMSSRTIKTSLQKVILQDPSTPGSINSRKQSTAFPPNFIHSLDATHMLLTAMAMKRFGLDFAAVHDSFWCHPGDVDVMSRVLREEFVKLHCEGDIMKRLHDEFELRYGERFIPVELKVDAKTYDQVMAELSRRLGRKKNPKKVDDEQTFVVWVPLRMPNVPQRGELDVRQVLDSPYFFH